MGTLCEPGSVAELWQTAFSEYFYERLSSRYLEPISVLQDCGTFQGEGFSIVAIQCSLIEFLESTVQGLSYRYRRRNDPPIGPHEYSGSGDIFVQFLAPDSPLQRTLLGIPHVTSTRTSGAASFAAVC
jgi:hypothetical protein